MKNKTLFIGILLLSILSLFSFPARSQEYISNVIFGEGNDCGSSIFQDMGDSVNYGPALVISGYTESHALIGGKDAIIAKYNLLPGAPYLSFQWAYVLGNQQDDYGLCVKQYFSQYLLCGGVNRYYGSNEDILLAKFTRGGGVIFAKRYDVSSWFGTSKDDEARKMIVDTGGESVIVGHTFNHDADGDILVAKFSATGTPLWATAIGDSGARDIGRAITRNSSGNYVIVGYTDAPGNRDIVVSVLNSTTGALLASVRVGSSREDYPWGIVDDPEDSSYVISGWTRGFNSTGKADLLIFKINYSLTFAWGKTLFAPGAPSSNSEASESLIRTASGDFMVAGFTENYSTLGSDTDVLFALFGPNLNLQWAKIWNEYSTCFSPDKLDEAAAITEVQYNGQHGFAATGSSKSFNLYSKEDIFITSFNENSKSCFEDISPTITDTTLAIYPYGWAMPVELIEDSTLFVRVSPEDSLICPCSETGVDLKEGEEQYPDDFDILDNYPNPFNPTTTVSYTLPKSGNVTLTIYNTLGQVVATLVDKLQSSGTHQVTWAAKNQPSGVYFYQLKFENRILATRKMLLVR